MRLQLYENERAAGRAVVFAIVIGTIGSTYRKPGAFMTIAGTGQREGLLSGGCLEADLAERARRLLSDPAMPALEIATYDSRSSDDPIWGLGLGCEGLMRIALLRVDASRDWQPLATLARWARELGGGALALALEATHGTVAAGDCASFDPAPAVAGRGSSETTALARSSSDVLAARARERWSAGGAGIEHGIFSVAWPAAPRVLICGAGPDVEPIVGLGARLGWALTIVDHRSAYLEDAQTRLTGALRCETTDLDALPSLLAREAFAAAVVMSHHLAADARYLAALADAASIGFVGLLGPPARRERLVAELGEARAAALRGRLRAPVGLDLGGADAEAIALAIVAELQAFLHRRSARALSDVAPLARP